MVRFYDRFAELCESGLFCFSIVVLVSFLTVVVPVMIGGLHASGDLGIYLGFAQEIRSSIDNGIWFPGWANDNLGFGSVGIRFYPPVSFYTSALLSFLIGDWYYVVCTYFFLWMVPGCWGIYLLLREWVSGIYALLGAVLYAVIPFHLAEIYQFSLYAEFAAGAVLPFCFLYATRICHGGKWADVIGFAAACALLILTHIPSTIIGAVSLGVYIALLFERRNFASTAVKFAVAMIISLAASSFYWVTVVNEVAWVAHNQPQYSSGLANYTRWLFPHLLFAGSSPNYYGEIFRTFDIIIVITGGFFVPATLCVLARRFFRTTYPDRLLTAVFVTGMFGVFMLSHASSFIWASVETLQKIQFPWRWLTVVSILGTVTLVLSVSAAVAKGGRVKAAALIYLALLSGLVIAYDVRKSFMRPNIVSRSEFDQVLEIKNAQAGNSFAAWWPVWARSEGLQMPECVKAGERTAKLISWHALERSFLIGSGAAGAATVATFYYPHWKAAVNGETATVTADEHGLITIPVPEAETRVDLWFEEPVSSQVGRIASMITWLGLFGATFLLRRRRPKVI